ncbi:MAG: glutamate racemase [Candidatus Eisenbacteria bacterium]|nr:glutamate racemase [Candidatus Eisenbacteria bacterium]
MTHSLDERSRPIGVFDSGIGGLTVVRALRRCLPGEDILYFGDAARLPYGTKSADTVLRFSRECVSFLSRRGIKMLVVACNTASAVALPVLTESLAMPAVGVIAPGVAAARRISKRKRVGVIATEATVASGSYRIGLQASGEGWEVFETACPLFVPLVEEGWISGELPRLAVQRYLAPLLDRRIDVLILGCTHYPLLREVIEETAGPEIALIDSGEEAARETAARLTDLGMANPRAEGGRCSFFVTDRPRRFEEIGAQFLGRPLEAVTLVDQSDVPWYDR